MAKSKKRKKNNTATHIKMSGNFGIACLSGEYGAELNWIACIVYGSFLEEDGSLVIADNDSPEKIWDECIIPQLKKTSEHIAKYVHNESFDLVEKRGQAIRLIKELANKTQDERRMLHSTSRLLNIYLNLLTVKDVIIEYAKSNDGNCLLGNEQLRVNWVTTMFAACFSNCHGTLVPIQSLFAKHELDNFSIEEELLKGKWLIGITGDLMCDIYSNFVGNYVKEQPIEKGIEFAEDCIALCITQFKECISSNYTVWACIPPICFSDDKGDIENYFETFKWPEYDISAVPQEKASQDTLTSLITNAIVENVPESIGPFSFMPDLNQIFLAKCGNAWFYEKTPHVSIIDNRMIDPAKAFNGINLQAASNIFSATDWFEDETEDLPGAPDNCSPKEIEFIVNQVERSSRALQRIGTERHEYQVLRHIVEEQSKLIQKNIDLKSQVERLQQAMDSIRDEQAEAIRKLKSQNEILRRKNQKLTGRVEYLDKVRTTVEKVKEDNRIFAKNHSQRVVELEAEVKSLQQALLGMEQAEGVDDTDTDSAELDTSVFNELRIVSVGGHPSWAKEMRNLHPNIKIFDSSSTPPDNNILRNADVIWLMVNAINHPLFYRVSATAARYNIPVRYFKQAGHRQCKRQIIQETQELFSRESDA